MCLKIRSMELLLVVVITTAFSQTGVPNTDWYTADPKADVFYISTADELAGLSVLSNGRYSDILEKTIILANDIDLASYGNWMPISANGYSFTGIFDGNNKVISNLTITDGERSGLFADIGGGTVKNLGIENIDITSSREAGGIAGYVFYDGIIENCYVSGNVITGDRWAGGIVGMGDGVQIVNSHFIGTVSGGGSVGGIAGKGNVTNCYSMGTVSGDIYVGGIVGEGNAANSYFIGTVNGVSSVGGVVGIGDATNCYSMGTVNGIHNSYSNTGGIGGVVGGGNATNCYSISTIIGGHEALSAGGIVGGGTATNCAALNPIVKVTTNTDYYLGFDETTFTAIYGQDVGRAGRVTNFNRSYANSDGFYIDSNVGLMEMGTDGGSEFSGEPHLDGFDITMIDALSDGTLGGLFTDTDVWIIAPNEFPKLKGMSTPPVITLNYAGNKIMGTASQVISESGGSGTAVAAIANDGFEFVSWSDGVTTATRTDANITDSRVIAAYFNVTKLPQYTLRYTAMTGGSITGVAEQTVVRGASGTAIVAMANDGYQFVRWSDGVTTAERKDENVMANYTVRAEFARREYTLNYTLGEGGALFIGGSAAQSVLLGGDGEEIFASAESGNTFVRWNDGSTANPRKDMNVVSSKTVMACFADADGKELDCDEYVSIKTADRTIPTVPNKDAAVVMSMSAGTLSFEVTAGPNPIRKSDRVIKFFCQGTRVNDGALTIYDATGNVVSKITICDNAVLGCQAKRQVGAWDLTYSNGKRVATGTYLVRGSVKTADGKNEKVSLLLGVR